MKFNSRAEWLAARKNGIGGSDAGAVLGIDPWKSNVDIFRFKTGKAQQPDISGKEAVKYGIAAEPLLRELFALDYPQYIVEYEEFNLHQHPVHPFIQASLDAYLTHRETGAKGFLEIKTTEILRASDRAKWDGKIPQNYFAQVVHYFLARPDFSFAWLKVQMRIRKDGDVYCETKHFYFERKALLEDIQALEAAEVKFWNEHVLPNKEPALLLPRI